MAIKEMAIKVMAMAKEAMAAKDLDKCATHMNNAMLGKSSSTDVRAANKKPHRVWDRGVASCGNFGYIVQGPSAYMVTLEYTGSSKTTQCDTLVSYYSGAVVRLLTHRGNANTMGTSWDAVHMSKASEAILDVLRDIKATPEATVETFEVGIPLVLEQGFSQEDVVNGLFWLQSENVIELLNGHRLRLVEPLPEAP